MSKECKPLLETLDAAAWSAGVAVEFPAAEASSRGGGGDVDEMVCRGTGASLSIGSECTTPPARGPFFCTEKKRRKYR